MKILTFDTSLNKTYVTLSDNENILASVIVENHNEKYHSAFLIPTIVSILKKHNLTMQDIEVIGTNVGPGSFTGIRACVTVARVFAQQLNIPLVGVSSLEILAHLNQNAKKTIVVLDARKNQFYTAVYDAELNEIEKPKLTQSDEMLRMDFDGAFVVSDEASSKVLKESGIESVIYTENNADLGLFLGKITLKKFKNAQNDEFLWGKLKPLYLQTPPISCAKKTSI